VLLDLPDQGREVLLDLARSTVSLLSPCLSLVGLGPRSLVSVSCLGMRELRVESGGVSFKKRTIEVLKRGFCSLIPSFFPSN
jgi:hypothetical protein